MARQWLIDARKRLNVSQKEVEKMAGLPPDGRYGRLEKGYTEFKSGEAEALAAAFKESPEYIRTGKMELVNSGSCTALPSNPIAASQVTGVKESVPSPQLPARQEHTEQSVANAAVPTPRGLSAARSGTLGGAAQMEFIEGDYRGEPLVDPANFRIVPRSSTCDRGVLDHAAWRAQLAQFMRIAQTVLHTPRVPPKVWARWREMEKKAQSCLQAPDVPFEKRPAVTVNAAPPSPSPSPQPQLALKVIEARKPQLAAPAALNVRRGRSHKTPEAKFVDRARELLAPEAFSRVEKAAVLAKTSEPTSGFMKHFFRLAAGGMFSAEEFALVTRAVERSESEQPLPIA